MTASNVITFELRRSGRGPLAPYAAVPVRRTPAPALGPAASVRGVAVRSVDPGKDITHSDAVQRGTRRRVEDVMASRIIPDLEGLAAQSPDSLELARVVLRHADRTRGNRMLLLMAVSFLLGIVVRGGARRG